MFFLYYGDYNVFVVLWGLLCFCCIMGIIMFLLYYGDYYVFVVLWGS